MKIYCFLLVFEVEAMVLRIVGIFRVFFKKGFKGFLLLGFFAW